MGSKLYVLSLIIFHFQSIAIHMKFNATQDLFKVEHGLIASNMSTALNLSFRIWSFTKLCKPNVPLDMLTPLFCLAKFLCSIVCKAMLGYLHYIT